MNKTSLNLAILVAAIISAASCSANKSANYYIMAHMSLAAKPGAVVIGNNGYKTDVHNYSPFRNSDGSYGVALSNSSDTTLNVTIDDGINNFNLTIPANGITTAVW